MAGMLEPLCFKLSSSSIGPCSGATNIASPAPVPCILCTEVFSDQLGTVDKLSDHLLACHNVVIKNLQNIVNLPVYMLYWKERVIGGLQLREFCSTVSISTTAEPNLQFILSSELAEDRDLRLRLKTEKLQDALQQQQKERDDDNFTRNCLFCTKHFNGNRSKLFTHMAEFHNFDLGDVDNLVYTSELLSLLEGKLINLQCLYCEKTFKDGPVLKEHMRKKRHKRLHRTSTAYQRFYIASYLEGKADDIDDAQFVNDESCDEEVDDCLTDEDVGETRVNDEKEWSDWVESAGCDVFCLFCCQTSPDAEILLLHLTAVHGFDLRRLISENQLTFYQRIKLINFMRRQLHYNACTFCAAKFDNHDALSEHLSTTDHSQQLPDASNWNQAQYYFPTYENDSLLCSLMDNDDAASSTDFTGEMLQVIAEDLPECVANLALHS